MHEQLVQATVSISYWPRQPLAEQRRQRRRNNGGIWTRPAQCWNKPTTRPAQNEKCPRLGRSSNDSEHKKRIPVAFLVRQQCRHPRWNVNIGKKTSKIDVGIEIVASLRSILSKTNSLRLRQMRDLRYRDQVSSRAKLLCFTNYKVLPYQ